jgi:hypothetical protein
MAQVLTPRVPTFSHEELEKVLKKSMKGDDRLSKEEKETLEKHVLRTTHPDQVSLSCCDLRHPSVAVGHGSVSKGSMLPLTDIIPGHSRCWMWVFVYHNVTAKS